MNAPHSRLPVRLLFGIALAATLANAVCPRAVAALMQSDDPFADELNPFGTGKSPAPAAVLPQPKAEPKPETQSPPELPRPRANVQPNTPGPGCRSRFRRPRSRMSPLASGNGCQAAGLGRSLTIARRSPVAAVQAARHVTGCLAMNNLLPSRR